MESTSKSTQKKFTTKDMVIVGLMAAMVFVFTYFFGIKIPTPTGTTMLKTANAVCLLAGVLFGGVKGGLAAGFGSAMFDLTYPEYAASAPVTFLMFFAMGCVAGVVANIGKPTNITRGRVAIGATCGSLTYILLYIIKNVGTLVLAGSEIVPAFISLSTKLVTSGINAVFAVVVTTIFAPVLYNALKKSKVI